MKHFSTSIGQAHLRFFGFLFLTLNLSLLLSFRPLKVKEIDNSGMPALRDDCWTSVLYQKNALVLICYVPCCYYEDHINANEDPDGTCKREYYQSCITP